MLFRSHSKGGKILFFSAGIEERNVELAEKMMKMALGEDLSGVSYQVFSRQHCIDTHGWGMSEEEKESYQSYHYGQRKKKLAGIVVPEAALSNTLLIEDDVSYMVKGEEYNFIGLRYCYEYLHDEKRDAFTIFHRAYYLAGLFATMFEVQAEKGITLVEAAKFVQIDSEGAELSRSFYYPSNKKLDYYLKGQKILSEIDPTLQFFYPIPENKENIERD